MHRHGLWATVVSAGSEQRRFVPAGSATGKKEHCLARLAESMRSARQRCWRSRAVPKSTKKAVAPKKAVDQKETFGTKKTCGTKQTVGTKNTVGTKKTVGAKKMLVRKPSVERRTKTGRDAQSKRRSRDNP